MPCVATIATQKVKVRHLYSHLILQVWEFFWGGDSEKDGVSDTSVCRKCCSLVKFLCAFVVIVKNLSPLPYTHILSVIHWPQRDAKKIHFTDKFLIVFFTVSIDIEKTLLTCRAVAITAISQYRAIDEHNRRGMQQPQQPRYFLFFFS